MKITVVCDVLGVPNNGTSIAAYTLINYLLKKGHQVHVVCPDKDKRGMKGYYVVPTKNMYIFNGYIEHNGVVISKRDDVILMRAIRDADLVHIMMPFGLGKRAAYICKRYHIPCTAGFHVQAENFTSHFFIAQNSKWINKEVYKYYFKNMYSYLDAIHYPTKFIRRVFEDVAKVTTNGYVISNGISSDFTPKKVDRPYYLENKIIILYSARFAKEKAHWILLKAVKYSKYRDKIQIIFAGTGPQEKKLRKLAYKEKLMNPPIFQLFTHEQMINVIRMSDLYVHPSNIEIEGISCLEAIAGGLVPIVSNSDRSATKDFALSKWNLFKANNPKDLAKKIDHWIAHPDLKRKEQNQYRKFIKNYDREHCMELMEKMFIETIKQKKDEEKEIH